MKEYGIYHTPPFWELMLDGEGYVYMSLEETLEKLYEEVTV